MLRCHFSTSVLGFVVMENCNQRLVSSIQCKYLNTIFEYNDIVIFIYSNYPFHQNTKSSDTKCFTPSIKCFFIWIKRLMYMKITMPLHSNLAFRNLQCRKHWKSHVSFDSFLAVCTEIFAVQTKLCYICGWFFHIFIGKKIRIKLSKLSNWHFFHFG